MALRSEVTIPDAGDLAGGRISEHGGGMPARIWDFEPGHFRWFDASERLVLKNESAAPIHLVAVEVF